MPGMTSGLSSDNPTIVAAFRGALLHQLIFVLAVAAVLALAWLMVREWVRPALTQAGSRVSAVPEPAWRQLLRIGFGVIWIVDGLLQAQPAMAEGLPSQVIQPAAASSPGWVQHIVNWAGTSWSYHPIQAGASAVWIQIGIGVWLITAPPGLWSRLAGLASAGWALVVWVFGEAFGGIFAPGLTWLFGGPGAAVFYLAAGLLIAAPPRLWRAPQLGRTALSVLGAFFLGMAVLQAWPGRGFWQGTLHGNSGTLTGMIRSMATTPQPALLAGWVSSFASFTAAHGFAVNLFTVIALAAIGTGLVTAGGGRPGLLRLTVIAMVVLCLADWVLIEDFGVFGGLGTDPNSMIPLALLGVAGYLALAQASVAAGQPEAAAGLPAEAEPALTGVEPASAGHGWSGRFRSSWLAQVIGAFGAARAGAVLTMWALVIVFLGAAPMAMAQTSRSADPIIAQAVDGDAAPLDITAPAFQLRDQYNRPTSLAGLRGKVVLLTFLDPVCTSDCPLIAQEFREADQMLGPAAGHVELVAIVANPIYHSLAYTQAFDQQERLTGLPNWLYLTGTLGQLRQAWKNYAVAADILPAGGMIAHSDVAYVIDASGHTRSELNFDPGPGTSSTESSFAAELTSAAEQAWKQS
jgi:cytochrome oxidase Cu insertion factor (SCO1/SenC/PrrC family)